ncbi:MAG TPA: peptidoglycan-associated lipoprotein Pal [Halothiobacillaceae bacterium]|nr:peptidoglycan-associated lipoprotein Pal [Halothiobacillaceae bacterium]
MRWIYLLTAGVLAATLTACSSAPKDGPGVGEDAAAMTEEELERARAEAAALRDADRLSEVELYAGAPMSREPIVYFGFDEYTVDEQYRDMLREHAAFLMENRDRRVVIEGHTDNRGSREYNIGLGERRANAVRDILLSHGVSSTQIDTVSYGKERPAVEGYGEDVWSMNRRAVIVYGR